MTITSLVWLIIHNIWPKYQAAALPDKYQGLEDANNENLFYFFSTKALKSAAIKLSGLAYIGPFTPPYHKVALLWEKFRTITLVFIWHQTLQRVVSNLLCADSLLFSDCAKKFLKEVVTFFADIYLKSIFL